MNRFKIAVAVFVLPAVGLGGDWNQWRGADGTGTDSSSPALKESLPDDGLKPLWVSEPIRSARDGGWGSPTSADGRVFLYGHFREQVQDPGQRQYPYLAPDKRTGMTDDEYREYENNRRAEDEARANAYRFYETLYCLDAQTGKTIWKNERTSVYSRFPQSGTPTIVDGRVFILGAARMARCFDAVTGEQIWEERLPGDFRDEFMQASFAVSDGTAAIMATHLYGLDVKSGKIKWQCADQRSTGSHSSPVIWSGKDDRAFVVNVSGGATIAVDPESGEELWRAETEAGLSTPIVVGNRLITYGNSRGKGLRCFDIAADGVTERWVYHGVADKGSSPVVVRGHIYVQGEKRLACVDIETGKAAWMATLDLERPQYTSLIAADDKVIYGHRGLLCFRATDEDFQPLIQARIDGKGLIAPEDFFREKLGLDQLEREPDGQQKALKIYQKEVGRHGPLDCSTPAISNGLLFIRLKDAVACYDLSA